MIDSRETEKKAFVIGSPIRHSRSPLIHSYWLKQFGLAGSYQAIDVPEAELETFFSDLRSKGDYRGGNVTLPHKERAYHLADEPDELSREIGAANTIWVEEGRIKATNTDSYGFAANLDARAPGWDKIGSTVILGAGGASRAVIQAVRNRGIGEIHVVNRTLPRAQDLARHFASPVFAHSFAALPELLRGSRLLINTTSLGMHGETAVDIDLSVMAPQAIVTDIVYVPLETPLLAEARRQGLTTVDGLGMLLHQAVPGFETWFGQRPVVDDNLRNLVIADMGKTA